ncbi:unnamed protein product [marine sediment metagenome]|uniref:DUF72 domain-containing protein n=1 Tax=marine sediment metagenome TaxID=412755 RepID=X1AFG0_9ZZZZ
MSKCVHNIKIGTSGWHYDHWIERFYPGDLPKNKWLTYYAEHFDTVEINNTFYQLPKAKTVENWHQIVPNNFLYAVKANRFITHIKRLNEPAEPLERFFEIVNLLKEKLGPVLYQLPPSFHKDIGRLRNFLALLPDTTQSVFEFRHKSWFSQDTYKLLEKHNISFCVHDMQGLKTPLIVTGDTIYIRFHGSTGRYEGNYTESMLSKWASWIKKQKARNIYAYFNNDYNAYAVYNAKTLTQLLNR